MKLDLRATLEVDAEVETHGAERHRADQNHNSRKRQPHIALAHEVDLQPASALNTLGAHEARVAEPAEVREQAEHGARAGDRRDQRDAGAEHQHQREALDPSRGDQEEHGRGDEGDNVGVEDGVEAARVAHGNGGFHRLARTGLLLDALEDDDVGIGRDADREDHAREARQGQGDIEEQDHPVEEDGVDTEPDHRDETEEAVEQE